MGGGVLGVGSPRLALLAPMHLGCIVDNSQEVSVQITPEKEFVEFVARYGCHLTTRI